MADAPHLPPPPASKLAQDTPRKGNLPPHMHSDVTQEEARSGIQKDMEPSLITCTAESWFNCYAPSQQPWNVGGTHQNTFIDQIKNKLSSSHSSKGWISFNNARDHDQSENTTYSTIAELAKEIGDAAQEIDSQLIPTLVLHASPQTLVTSEVVGYQFYPDARGTVVESKAPKVPIPKRRSTRRTTQDTPVLSKDNCHTAVIAEYKLKAGPADRMDDERKLIGAATALMYNDPRRRHLMGFTIERDQMRMWYFCRSHVCVSEAFNFQTEPKFFIRFLLTIHFATPTELGYDLSIERLTIPNAGKDVIAYQYKVDDAYYLTQGHPLSEDAAYRMVSRATRVWKVKKMVMGANGWTNELEDKEYVLKDVWLYEDALLECEIKQAIFDALKQKDNTEKTTHATDAEPYFMTYAHDWKVRSEHLPSGDRTPSLPEDWKSTQFSRQHQRLTTPNSSAQRVATRDPLSRPEVSASAAVPLQHHARIHVRTVFEEVCQTLYEITDYKTVVDYIIQIVQALRYMYLAGFVHRDISPGNCLWHVPEGRAKISDLEYARPFSELSGHDPRTGTPSFMAVEYQSQSHLFGSPASLEFFTFNFYHDLESVFWLYVWSLHKCPPATLTLGDDHTNILLQSTADHLDCGITGASLRSAVLTRRANILVYQLKPVYAERSYLLDALESRSVIRAAYETLEDKEPWRNAAGKALHWDQENFESQVYDDFRKCFQDIRDKLLTLNDDVPVKPRLPQSMKRIAETQSGPTTKPTKAKKTKNSM
ncbi:hypothetical protein C8R47DRAFT_1323354 [Mycena vitilis]|nr:hypothetical protein C8R47DRAFT_1323354 [Mycena vitilis]